jgi:hypothetical protein
MRENVMSIGLPNAMEKLRKLLSGVPVSYGSWAVKPSHGSR